MPIDNAAASPEPGSKEVLHPSPKEVMTTDMVGMGNDEIRAHLARRVAGTETVDTANLGVKDIQFLIGDAAKAAVNCLVEKDLIGDAVKTMPNQVVANLADTQTIGVYGKLPDQEAVPLANYAPNRTLLKGEGMTTYSPVAEGEVAAKNNAQAGQCMVSAAKKAFTP